MLELAYTVSDADLRAILETSRTIAVVGASNDHYYTSYDVTQYLKEAGYQVYVVNPTIPGVKGDPAYPALVSLPDPVDIVDVFRNSDYLDEVARHAIAADAKTLWNQLDVVSVDGAPEQAALAAGLRVVSNRCIRTEHERLRIAPKPGAPPAQI
jgi:predicted CoA-binding protein